MHIAILADTHGNLHALDTVMADIERAGPYQLVCLGDVAGLGPWPRETLERVRQLGCPVVMGNADEFMIDPAALEPARHADADEHTHMLHDMERWAAEQLTEEDRAFISTFQPTVTVGLGNGQSLLCYHGSPRSAWEGIYATTPDDEVRSMLGERHLVMAGGHTHEQMLRRLHETVLLNPGSVGLPYETLRTGGARNPLWAEYALLTVEDGSLSVDLRRVPIDGDVIRQALLESGMPHAEVWAADWR
jgi:predicted phosphodiesterase